MCGAGFEAIMEGEFNNHCCIFWKGVTAAVLGIPLALVVAKYLWRRSWKRIRLRFNLRLLSCGVLLGLILPLFIVAILFALNMAAVVATPARFASLDLLSMVVGAVCFATFTAFAEELVFRGMAVREWAVRMGWPLAALFGGLYFGAAHLVGLLTRITPAQGVWILISALIAGILFVAMYVRSKSLWLPIGFHFGWNICLEFLLGTTISGQEAQFGLFRTELSGPAFLTGGGFGIESSVITYLFYIVAAILFLRYSRTGRPLLLNANPV
jgi:membrane protease YdiL (CAAX protease family)